VITTTRAKLIVTVDTEEEGLWNGSFRPHGNTVENTGGIERFQAFCDRFNVRPTYLVDTPVVEDERSVGILRDIESSGRCEIGAHLHPWCAPPFDEQPGGRNSYLCNLPESLQREKLSRLTERIEERFGRRPTAFRAGRYGLDIVGAKILEELGYRVDSSVLAFGDYSSDGGPDYRAFPFVPYRVGPTDLKVPCVEGTLLEAPVSAGFSRTNFDRSQSVRQWAENRVFRPFRLVGVLDRLNLVRKIKFSPEQADAARMKQLVDAYASNGAPCMVMMLHSSSLVAGLSPYAADDRTLDGLYRDLQAAFEHCLERHGMIGETLTDFGEGFLATT